jgi:hypothetical protein
MKKIILSIMAVLSLTACSAAQASNAADQVRQTEYRVVTLLSGSHPFSACKYYTVASHAGCLKGVLMAKSMGVPMSSLFPSGWQIRLARAKVTIRGNRAHMTSPIMGTGKVSTFTRVDGHWLIGS